MIDDSAGGTEVEGRGSKSGFVISLVLMLAAVAGSFYLLIQDRNDEAVAEAAREVKATAKKVGASVQHWRFSAHRARAVQHGTGSEG